MGSEMCIRDRLGCVCGHERIVQAFADVKDNSDSGQFIAIQQAGAVAAHRHGCRRVVTVAMEKVVFHAPVRVGDLVSFYTEIEQGYERKFIQAVNRPDFPVALHICGDATLILEDMVQTGRRSWSLTTRPTCARLRLHCAGGAPSWGR